MNIENYYSVAYFLASILTHLHFDESQPFAGIGIELLIKIGMNKGIHNLAKYL